MEATMPTLTGAEDIVSLPMLPLRGLVAFPDMILHFDVGREISIRALEYAMQHDQMVFLTSQKDLTVDIPQKDDVYAMGTICQVRQVLKIPGGAMRIMVEGKSRATLLEMEERDQIFHVTVRKEKNFYGRASHSKITATIRALREAFEEYADMMPRISADVAMKVATESDPGYLADYVAQNISLSFEYKQQVLQELHTQRRLEKITRLLGQETEILRMEADIQEKLRVQIDRNQRDYYLREQMKVIQNELGEGDELSEEVDLYREKISQLQLDEDSKEKLYKEADRLLKMHSSSAESAVIRTYLDICLDIPWAKRTKDQGNLATARKILDREHFGLEKVKERILEILAVKKLSPQVTGQVLCLVGPPGVGKTSIAKSVAHAMGRNCARISLGGMRDEADIRGHRKTYIGAMPGRIVNGLRQAGSTNCVLVLDEIDKMGNDFRGDPASAMLEVLDTEQNSAFRDHFVEIPVDLSQVLFITTANTLSTIPAPLLDRMEIIELEGYTDTEKLAIAKQYLLPKQLKKHGITRQQLSVTDAAILDIMRGYTREAGVRKLEQQLAKICRQCAKSIASGEAKRWRTDVKHLEEVLGVRRYKDDSYSRVSEIGVVNGLAWTSVGGEILEVEVSVCEGGGKIQITGNLGNVMQESVQAAITYVRTVARRLKINPMFYQTMDIHIHFPEAAIPKDGPSAGITIATAIVSALTGAPCRSDVAMTGEVTLRGRVLPIGGLKDKTMAAYRYGIKTVIVPDQNESDLQEIDATVREHLEFVLASDMQKVLDTALDFSNCIKPYIPEKKAADTAVLTQ